MDDSPNAAGELPHRRWNDHLGDLPQRMLGNFLLDRPSRDEVVRYLAALLVWPSGARGVLIVEGDGAAAHISAAFIDNDLPDGPAWRVGALPPALAELLNAPDQLQESDINRATVAGETPVLILPMGNAHSRIGYLVVMLTSSAAMQRVAERLAQIPQMIGIYLAGAGSVDAPSAHAPTGGAGATEHSLTDRQLRILRLLAEGFTMQQIAHRIGFSESTVRMESLAIYRSLGVHDRDDAVHEGLARGLIQ